MECKNCLKTQAHDFHYCPECGAKVIRNRLTLKNLWTDIVQRYFDLDNRFLKTFIYLITKPKDVIDGYIKGVRKKYVNPISYFAIALTLAGVQIFLTKKFFPNAYDITSITASGQEELIQSTMALVQEYSGLITMLMIPVYALMAKIVFLNKKQYNYSELVVVFLYFAAEVGFIGFLPFMAFLFLGFNYGHLSPFALVFQILIAAYYLKVLYNLSTKGILLRTLLFLVVLAVFYIVSVLIAAILMVAFGLLPASS